MTLQDTRLAATARYLADETLDGLIAFNGGQNSFLEAHAVFVLSGVRPIGESAVAGGRSGASTLMVTPAWEAEPARPRLSRTAKDRRHRRSGGEALGAALAAHKIDLTPAVHGRVVDARPRALVQGIEAELGCEQKVRANDKYARELARIRTPEELAAAQKGDLDRGARLRTTSRVRASGRARVRARGRALRLHEGARGRGQFPAAERVPARSRRHLPPARACSTWATSSSPRSRPAIRASSRRSAAPP